jgi:flagellar motor switch protein FliN/FliY
VVTGTRIAVEITEILKKPHVARVPGTTIGDASLASLAAAEA